MLLILLSLFCSLYLVVRAQIPLPTSPWLPQNTSFGAQPSQQNQIPNIHWSTLLGDLLYFYEAQRSGKLPPTNRVHWRNDSALSDGSKEGVDLVGGYYDAGDYIKATYPLSFTVMSICWGATDFGKGYDLANQTPYLDDMLRWSLSWLIKAHSSNNTLWVYVAENDTNGTYWGGDLNIPTPRPAYQINSTSPGTDAAAAASAAFSSCSSLYSSQAFPSPYGPPATLANTTYAQTLLTHAEQLYTFAVNATGGKRTYTSSLPASVAVAYNSTTYMPDLALSAAFLARAERSTERWKEAVNLYHEGNLTSDLQDDGAVFNWASKSAAVPILLAQMALSSSSGGQGEVGGDRQTWQGEAEKWADGVVNGKGLSSKTHGGLLYYAEDSQSASLNPALNAAMLLMRYAPMATSGDKQAHYLKFAQSQLDYVLGKNPMSVPYVVGLNPNSPSNPHSALASGGNNASEIDTVPAQEAYALYGAVVGGPNKQDKFWDIRSDWPENEVALDYNAPLLTLTVMHVSNTSTSNALDPPYVALQAGAYTARRPHGMPCDEAFPCGPPPLKTGAKIAMAVVISVVGLFLLGVLGYCCWRARTH